MLSEHVLKGTYIVDMSCQGCLCLMELDAEFIQHGGRARSGINGLGRVMCWLWLWGMDRWKVGGGGGEEWETLADWLQEKSWLHTMMHVAHSLRLRSEGQLTIHWGYGLALANGN